MMFAEYAAVLDGTLELLSAVSGMERENITRGVGWVFMCLGRRLERAMYSVSELRQITAHLGAEDWPLLEYLLEVADSSMTYRSRYFTTLQPIAVLDVLMSDGVNPRALDFQLSHLVDLYRKLPRHSPQDLTAMQSALDSLRMIDLQVIEFPLPGANLPAGAEQRLNMDRVLESIENLFPSWADSISNMYFAHARTLPITIGG